MTPRLARSYLVVQGAAVVAWWVTLALWPAAREPFRVVGAPDAALLAFAPGDLLILGAGSLAAALARGRRAVLAWLVAGATLYGALYTLSTAVSASSGWLGAALMTPAALLSLLSARTLTLADSRPLPPRRPGDAAP